MKIKGQIYFIFTFLALSLFFLLIAGKMLVVKTSDTNEKLVKDALLDLVYANYSTSCDNMKVIMSLAFGNVKFFYFINRDEHYTLCDPYSLVDKIILSNEKYLIVLTGGGRIEHKLEGEGYIVGVVNDNRKIYIEEGTFK